MTTTKKNKGSVLARLGRGGCRARRRQTLPPPNRWAALRRWAPHREALFCAHRSRLLVATALVNPRCR